MCTMREQLEAKGVDVGSIFLGGLPTGDKIPTVSVPKGKKQKRGKSMEDTSKIIAPSAPAEPANCFSVDHESIKTGIPIEFGNSVAIYVGDTENDGKEWYLPIDRYRSPNLNKDVGKGAKLLRADVCLTEIKGTKRFIKTIVKSSSENNSAMVLIRTGRSDILRSRFFQRVESFAGNPLRVIGGIVKSKKGAVSSFEQVWSLKEGDVVMVCFFDGSIKLLSYNKGQVSVSHVDDRHGKKLFGIVSRLEEIESLMEGEVKSRDRGYHAAIDAGLRTGFLQGTLDILEEVAQRHDLRVKVVEHLLKRGYDDEDSLRRIFKILCTNDKVYKNLKVQPKVNAEKEEIDNAVKMRDGAYHHAIDIAASIGWWDGVAELLMEARENNDLRAGVFNHFRNECSDGKLRALVGDSLHEAPGLGDIDFLKSVPRRTGNSSRPKAKKAEKSVKSQELRAKMEGISGGKPEISPNPKKAAKQARKAAQKKR